MPKTELDPRVNAFRPDLADQALASFVESKAFIEPKIHQCVKGVVPLLETPSPKAKRISEIRYGEFVDLFEMRTDGFAWIQNRTDRFVGYVKMDGAFNESIGALMNRITVLHSHVFAQPDEKAPVIDRLTLGSFVSLDGEEGDFYPLASGGYIYQRHVAPTDEVETPDYVFTAGQLLNVPYLEGGRTPLGIDGGGPCAACFGRKRHRMSAYGRFAM